MFLGLVFSVQHCAVFVHSEVGGSEGKHGTCPERARSFRGCNKVFWGWMIAPVSRGLAAAMLASLGIALRLVVHSFLIVLG